MTLSGIFFHYAIYLVIWIGVVLFVRHLIVSIKRLGGS